MKKLIQLVKDDPRKGVVTGVLVLTLIVLRLFLGVWLDDFSPKSVEDLDLSENGAYWTNLLMDLALWLTFYLISACLVGSFGVFIFRLIQDMKSAVKFGILSGSAVFLFILCWMFSTGDVESMAGGLDFTKGTWGTLKLTGGLVSYTLTLIVLGLIGAAGSSVIKLAK